MKKILIFSLALFGWLNLTAQTPNNCNGAVPGCTTPSFGIQPNNPATNIIDFTTGDNISNPSSPPYGNNSGCLLSGETSSTFITISVQSTGNLQWSIIGLTAAGTPSGSGCFDWIMWPYTDPNVTCAGITGNTLAPVACNWNGTCNGNTGMAAAGNLPPNGSTSSYVAPLAVNAGETYLLCLSNYSGTSQNVNLNFFGTANVSCVPSAPDQTICLGNSATVNIATPGLPNPSFNWLVTTGVSDPTAGTNVTVTPTVTTTYQVEVTNPATSTAPAFSSVVDFTITVATPPAPNAGPDQSVCLGQAINLSGTVGSASNTSSWASLVPAGLTPAATANFSPNFSTLTPTVTVNQPGLYHFILRENSPVCGIIRDTVAVQVSLLTQTVSKIDPSCGGYSDGQVIITSPTATEYSFDNGVTWQTSNTSSGFTLGTFNVCSRNALGCQICSPITLTEPTPVTVTVSMDTTVCQNGTAQLVASGNNGLTFSYIWGHTSNSGPIQNVSPSVMTYYDVIAVNENGCQSAPDSIQVLLYPPISGTISGPISICPGYPDDIDASASGGIGGPYTFTWTSGDVGTGFYDTVTVNPPVTSTYTLSITDACESSAFVLTSDVIVLPLPQPIIAAMDSSICEPAVFDVYSMTDPTMVATTYWKISDGQTFMNVNNFQTQPMYEGYYNVQLVVASPAGCIDSVTYNAFLSSNPKPVADYSWSPFPIQMFNTNVLFMNSSIHGYSYQWNFQNGIPGTSTDENPRIQFPEGIVSDYNTSLITTSEFGCIDTIEYTISVLPEVVIYSPNAFTPDDDEYNQTWKVVMDGIDIYDFELFIYNRWGETVWESHDISVGWDGTYNGTRVPEGTYTWTIRAKDALNDNIHNYSGYVTILK